MNKTTTRKITAQPEKTVLQKVETPNYNNKRRVHKFVDVNARFRQTRRQSGLGQVDFAAALGISLSQVAHIETDRITPNISVIRAWSKKFKVSTDWIIFGEK